MTIGAADALPAPPALRTGRGIAVIGSVLALVTFTGVLALRPRST